MKVTVRDQSAEPPWGYGPTRVATRQIEIDDNCPACGAPRGKPTSDRWCEDGVYFWVQNWVNPCGHEDPYSAVLKEAAARGTLGAVWLH